MANDLRGFSVAILVTDGFEQVEMTAPKEALEAASAKTCLIAPKRGEVQAWKHQEKGAEYRVEATLDSVDSQDLDGLLLPGGVANPDQLRTIPQAAAICHGPWLLVEAGVVKGRLLTSWPSLKTDIKNAGGRWVDSESGYGRQPRDEPKAGRHSCVQSPDDRTVPDCVCQPAR